jgi:hypothetical protein
VFRPQMLFSDLQGALGKRQRLEFRLIVQRDNLSAKATGLSQISRAVCLRLSFDVPRDRRPCAEGSIEVNQR